MNENFETRMIHYDTWTLHLCLSDEFTIIIICVMCVSRSKIVSARGNFFEVKNIKIAIDSYFASRFLLVCVKIGHFSITSYSSFDVGSTAGT